MITQRNARDYQEKPTDEPLKHWRNPERGMGRTLGGIMITFTELLKKAKTEKIAIHTATEAQAKKLLKALYKREYEWLGGEKLTGSTYYEYAKENTCYVFGIDAYGNLLNKNVVFSSLKFHQDNNYTIIEFTDIDFKVE